MKWKRNLNFILLIISLKNSYELEKEKYKLSVIIPVYNVEKYLRECLDSVINQNYTNLEIICINDGSTDDSLEILKEYEKIDKRIKIHNQKNKGVSSARNKGMELSTGDYITFVDSDDYLDLNLYEKAMEIIVENNADIVNFNLIEQEKNGTEKKYTNLPFKIFINDSITAMQDERIFPAVWLKIFKRKFLIENNIFFAQDIYFGEDDLFRLKAFLISQKIITFPDVYYHYRYRNNSCTKIITTEERLINTIKRFKYLINFFQEHKFTQHNNFLINFSLNASIGHLLTLEKRSKKCYYAQQILNELNDLINQNEKKLTIKNKKDIMKLKKLCRKINTFDNLIFLLLFILCYTVMIYRIRQ